MVYLVIGGPNPGGLWCGMIPSGLNILGDSDCDPMVLISLVI